MDIVLGKITQHAMNYAIRAGIGITASYTIKQTSRLLRTVDDNADYQELRDLQEILNSNIKILSPAIDMVEIISARGNSSLESAVSMTRSLRWEIQSLGIRLAKAAEAEEASRKRKTRAISKAVHHAEIRLIMQDIKKLLARIEKEVPLINLAITASGAKISTTMPATVSPSRMMQAGTYISENNLAYFRNPDTAVQAGPTFTLSLYMLFAGHSNRVHEDAENMREMTWKEVIHKARVKLMRIPMYSTQDQSSTQILPSIEQNEDFIRGNGKHNEYAYHLEVVEDLDDDRVHSFGEDEAQPGPYGDVKLAGIRDFIPIHQISKIFYADTGKILGIGDEGQANSPVLLLKRDINALPPRKMMQQSELGLDLYEQEEEDQDFEKQTEVESENDSQDDIDEQIRRESAVCLPLETSTDLAADENHWRLPADLDPEWLALEVYVEPEESDSEDEQDEQDNINDDSAYISHRPSSSGEEPNGEALANGLAHLHLDQESPHNQSPARRTRSPSHNLDSFQPSDESPYGPIISSLSLLEMLIRLASLQQFTQAPHLCARDEILTFFLEDSSTTGAGKDGEERRRTRRAARQKVGFDPYDESPVKRHGEDYQYQNQGSRGNTPYDEYDHRSDYPMNSPRWDREPSMLSQRTPEPWMRMRDRNGSGSRSRRGTPEIMSSPISPYRPQQRKAVRPLNRVQAERGVGKGSPLGRGMSVETDSTLGTSPGSPTLVDRDGKL
ncbi:Ran-binding-domain-containing protein [Mollisia scopiformis]|uniref:Ran-binding-domain-containing protein n=1 Tax=Mollisia scopiformis TaxID=149040 RepID=A0A194XSI4_MOLSC|nr:Ran-binding-domain-containing protein [Mollisia scopiformis]KUJ23158.1 Ran-binding-domain-containing protein [Mollisia scopiformis]